MSSVSQFLGLVTSSMDRHSEMKFLRSDELNKTE